MAEKRQPSPKQKCFFYRYLKTKRKDGQSRVSLNVDGKNYQVDSVETWVPAYTKLKGATPGVAGLCHTVNVLKLTGNITKAIIS